MTKQACAWLIGIAALCWVSGPLYAEEQQWCPLCSMNLKMFWKSHNRLHFADGSSTGYCSIHCAAAVFKDRAADIDRWEVVDYDTGRLVNAHSAHFLIGSRIPGTMTAVSKLAFESPDTANKYRQEQGGEIGTFQDALKRALDDHAADKTMILKKVAERAQEGKILAEKHGCYACHGPGGAGRSAPAWTSDAFAQSMNSRVKIKNQIIKGSGKMPGYEGKITENDLHAITLYVWTVRKP